MTDKKWNSSLAHKLCINYWVFGKKEDHRVILRNPEIRSLAFFNPELSDELRKNEMRIVAGEFLRHFAQMDLLPQPNGTVLDDAFTLLVNTLAAGGEKISVTGDIVDSVYRFRDEE